MLRRALLAVLLAFAAAAGCLQHLTDELEESRERSAGDEGSGDADDPSSAGPTAPATTTPTPSPVPVTPASPSPTTPATPSPVDRTGPWPWVGSFVRYEARGGEGDATSWATRITLTYDGTQWTGACRGTRTERADDGTATARPLDRPLSFAPLVGPTDPTRGEPVQVHVFRECDVDTLHLLAQGTFPEDATRDGRPVRTTAWWADEGAQREPRLDADAWWDARTGLVLRWESAVHDTDRGTSGRLADTDAPLG